MSDALSMLPPAYVLDVELRAAERVQVPAWLGSTVHGALGGALRASTCSPACEARHREEPGRCPYARFFETPPAPPELPAWIAAMGSPPLALRLPPPGEPATLEPGAELRFGLVLFGEPAAAEVGYLVAALEGMGAHGLGKGRGKLALRAVRSGDRVLWEGGRFHATPAPLALEPWRSAATTVRALTPLRLVRGGALARPSFEDLVAACARRIVSLAAFFGRMEPSAVPRVDALRGLAAEHPCRVEGVWEPFRARRWSSRQRQAHSMDGYLGSMRISDVGPFAPWLRAAEIAGAGKGTAMGFGRIALEPAAGA